MNKNIRQALHAIGLAMATVLAIGVWDVFQAEVAVVLPVLKGGAFPALHQISDAFFPAVAKALGNCVQTFVTVAGIYVAKVKLIGSSQK